MFRVGAFGVESDKRAAERKIQREQIAGAPRNPTQGAPLATPPPPPAELAAKPSSTGLNSLSRKLLVGAAVLLMAIGAIVFLIADRAGVLKGTQSNAQQGKSEEKVVTQQPPPQGSGGETPANGTPIEPRSEIEPGKSSPRVLADRKASPVNSQQNSNPASRPALQQSAALPASLPPVMHICMAHCTVLTWENGHYVNYGPQNTSVYTVESFRPDSVILHRTDRGYFPLTAVLSGKLSPDGNSIINGKIVWTSGNTGQGLFKAAWGAAIDTVPGSGDPR